MAKKDRSNSANTSFPIVSLFCGAGGLDIGFRRAGFQPVLAMDIDEAAVETYKHNLPAEQRAHVLLHDLAKVTEGFITAKLREVGATEHPIGVVGGPPCQAFSIGNVYKAPDDPRAKLPFSYAKILHELNLRGHLHFFVFENVRGLRHLHADVLDAFKNAVGEGFHVFEGVLDAQNFGVAQQRKRLFVVGFNEEIYPTMKFAFPAGTERPVTVRDVIEGLPDPVYFARHLQPEDIPMHPNHWCMRPRSAQFTNGHLKPGETKGRPFRMLAWDKPSWTVAYGHREVHVHPSGRRRLSVYEAMRLQGFPKSYELRGTLSQQIRLVSDAVPPPLAEALARAIRRDLQLSPESQEEGGCQRTTVNCASSRTRSDALRR